MGPTLDQAFGLIANSQRLQSKENQF